MAAYRVDIPRLPFWPRMGSCMPLRCTAYGRDSLSARMHVYREVWGRNLLHRETHMVDMMES
jgi:hypothetical protein